MDETLDKSWTLLIYLILVLTIFIVFYQVRNFDFVNYDDPVYITRNRPVNTGLTFQGLIWAFTTGHAGNWHPLTWLSHMLDCQLFGNRPGWHHLTNLLLHIANSLLLFAVLKRMTRALWQSAFVAALFALHPLHVESVAWVSERKDVLSTLFWMLTIAAYLRYVEKPGVARYLLTLLMLALGLMAKPMLVTLPFVLLLLDYWPLNRFQKQVAEDTEQHNHRHGKTPLQSLVLEKVPFFVLVIISSVVTFLVQRTGGAVKRIEAIPLMSRMANAFVSYLEYIAKTIWPARLAAFYPHPGSKLPIWQTITAAIVLLAITICVFRLRRTRKYLPAGWFWYIGTLVPVIGLVQVGDQAMADRYTYVPLIGLFIIIAWGVPDILRKWQYRKITLTVSSGLVISALVVCSSLQTSYWRNSIALFKHALEVTEDNYVAYFCMTESLRQQGEKALALYYNSQSVRIKPDYLEAHNGLGIGLLEAGRIEDAISQFKMMLNIKPDFVEACANLGYAYYLKGDLDNAIEYSKQALQKNDILTARGNLAVALLDKGRLEEATEQFHKILQKFPDQPEAHNGLGTALSRQGRYDEAIAHLNQAIRINPNYTAARDNLNLVLAEKQKLRNKDTENTKK
jgi:tetratricopeptide (TPR) repeat protein